MGRVFERLNWTGKWKGTRGAVRIFVFRLKFWIMIKIFERKNVLLVEGTSYTF